MKKTLKFKNIVFPKFYTLLEYEKKDLIIDSDITITKEMMKSNPVGTVLYGLYEGLRCTQISLHKANVIYSAFPTLFFRNVEEEKEKFKIKKQKLYNELYK